MKPRQVDQQGDKQVEKPKAMEILRTEKEEACCLEAEMTVGSVLICWVGHCLVQVLR